MSVSESHRPTRVVLATERITDQALGPAHETEDGVSDAALTSHVLFVNPTRLGDGLRASINGHLLELADPGSAHRLAPTPDDLLIVSIASDLAWSARRFLRGHGLADDVNVSAAWRTLENPPRLADISVTVAVSDTAETMSDALMAALEERVAARSLGHSPARPTALPEVGCTIAERVGAPVPPSKHRRGRSEGEEQDLGRSCA